MNVSIVTGGLLGQGFVTGGFVSPLIISITDFADPRQGTLLSPDSDPLAVDPRQGTILFPDSDPLAVDPRKGTIIN